MTQGIYALRHEPTGRIYVGQSKNIATRFMQHLSGLRGGQHHNSQLQALYDQFGEASFNLEVLEEVDDLTVISEREIYWAEHLEAMLHQGGCNIARPGTVRLRGGVTVRRRLSPAMNPRDQVLSRLAARGETQKDLAEKLGVTPQALSRALNTAPDLRGIWRRLLDEFGLEVALVVQEREARKAKPLASLPTAAEARAQTQENIAASDDEHLAGVTEAVNQAVCNNQFIAYYPHVISEALTKKLEQLGFDIAIEPDENDEAAGETVIMWFPAQAAKNES